MAGSKHDDERAEREDTPPAPGPPRSAPEPAAPDAASSVTPPPARPRKGRRRRLASVVSVFGELLITAGVVMGLFVVYSLWWTNVLADRESAKQGDEMRHDWAREAPKGTPRAFDFEDGIGFLHVPAMDSGEVLVKKGTSTSALNNGIAGYYTDPVKSALPWDEKGNFSLAAHRDGHGARFHNIHKLKDGDPVVFETRDTWYVYKVFKTLPKTSKYNVDVLQPVPEESGKTKPGRYLTLTTCTPIYTSDFRYIVWAELDRTEKVDKERTPPRELR